MANASARPVAARADVDGRTRDHDARWDGDEDDRLAASGIAKRRAGVLAERHMRGERLRARWRGFEWNDCLEREVLSNREGPRLSPNGVSGSKDGTSRPDSERAGIVDASPRRSRL